MTHTSPPNGQPTAKRLKAELEQLKREQMEMLRLARFGGMTPAETKSYDERHGRIKELMQQLELFDKGTASV